MTTTYDNNMALPRIFGSEFAVVLYTFQDTIMIPFCFFSLIILVYYIRRRYHLYLEMKAITTEQLWFLSFQNHLKNLKIKALIANFVMIILLVEIGTRVCFFYVERWFFVELFHINFTCASEGMLYEMTFALEVVTQSAYIPLVGLFVKVVWLVYLHSPYKYSIMKWVAYIVMKIIAVYTCLKIEPIFSKMMYRDTSRDEVAIEAIFYLQR